MTSLPLPASLTDLVWLQTAFLGDIVLTTAAIHLVAEHWPHVRQHLITTPLGCKALQGEGDTLRCLPFTKGKGNKAWQAMQAVKQELAGLDPATSVLLQVHRSPRSSVLAAYLGLPRICYEETALSFLPGAKVKRVAVLHETARIGLLLERLGMPRRAIIAARPKLKGINALPAGSAAQASLAPLADERLVIGIAPGSVWGTKRWPVTHFARLLPLLNRALRAGSWGEPYFLLLGSADERPLCDELAERLAPAGTGEALRFINLAGATSLDDLRYTFPRLRLIVANDSSPIHYASAFNVPTLALFGATVPAMGFGPLASFSRSLGVDGLACRPCSDHGPMQCPLTHFRCMQELSPERVSQAAVDLLRAAAAPDMLSAPH